jgi:hypothetical protein
MTAEIIKSLLTGIIGAGLGYFAAWLKSFSDSEKNISDQLWILRKEKYQILWSILKSMPKWPTRKDFTFKQLRDMSEDMKNWYFDHGGMVLTSDAVIAYRKLQERMAEFYDQEKDTSKIMSPTDYMVITDLCSKLRTALTRDLLSRKRLFSR